MSVMPRNVLRRWNATPPVRTCRSTTGNIFDQLRNAKEELHKARQAFENQVRRKWNGKKNWVATRNLESQESVSEKARAATDRANTEATEYENK